VCIKIFSSDGKFSEELAEIRNEIDEDLAKVPIAGHGRAKLIELWLSG